MSSNWHKLLLIVAFVVVIFFHLFRLSSIPAGIYIDEASIGHNAHLIAYTGHDEHNVYWPVFFEAFGEYKNPLFIYLVALFFKIFGTSVFWLRFTSAFFAIVFVFLSYSFVKEVYANKYIHIFAVIVSGFLPWFFTMSRVGFEVISQVTLVMGAILFIYKTYERSDDTKRIRDAILAGLFIGLSIYTYSTARLLTFLLLGCLVVIYYSKKYWKSHGIVISSFVFFTLPYYIFSIVHPGALSSRFHLVSYWYDSTLSLGQKIAEFFHNYFYYISFKYLVLIGDSQLRHHSAFRGELFAIIYGLAIIGICYVIYSRFISKRFSIFLISQFILAGVAGALTTGDSSLRTVLIGLYATLFACFGFFAVTKINHVKSRRSLLALCFIALIFESALYVRNYFTVFPNKSIQAFETYDYGGVLVQVLNENPTKIVISSKINGGQSTIDFYNEVYNTDASIGDLVAEKDKCILFNTGSETLGDALEFKVKNIVIEKSQIGARCYQ